MKRNFTILIISSFIFILTACGMTAEEIDTVLMQLNTTYQSGTYEQALTEVKKLDKSSKKMSDEQKSKFDELKSSLEYAISSVQGINDGFNKAQSYYDQKMYYEAQQELDKISQTYKLPPAEQKKFDEKQGTVSQAITSWKITETIQKAETILNSGDYNSASKTLSEIDSSNLTEEQKQEIISLNEKIASAKAKAEAERKMVKSSQKAVNLVYQEHKRKGIDDEYLGNVYKCEDFDTYYLVKITATQNADGQDRYKVYKSTGNIEYIGCGSDWIREGDKERGIKPNA